MHTTSSPTILRERVDAVQNRRKAMDTLVHAFRDDPAARWLYPSDEAYFAGFPRFATAFGGGAVDTNTAWQADRYRGVALWFAPGTGPDGDAIAHVVADTIPAQRLEKVFALFEQMDAFHPEYQHWYLPMIGVHPATQGKGLGSMLLRRVLDTCDRSGTPAYLESSNPANLSLYERQGFRVVGEIQAGDSPYLYPMVRRPA